MNFASCRCCSVLTHKRMGRWIPNLSKTATRKRSSIRSLTIRKSHTYIYATGNRVVTTPELSELKMHNQTSGPELKTLLTGLAMGESPRWHDDRLWFSDWGAQEVIAVDLDGNREVVLRTAFGLPFCIDWLPDGRLLIVSGREGRVLRREFDGSLVPLADLRGFSDNTWNEIVVDGRGNAYVNGVAGVTALVLQ